MSLPDVVPRQAVYRHLLDDPAVATLVQDRIYYRVRPDGAGYPCIVITTVIDVPRRDLQGVAWTETRLQLTAMAETEPGAEMVARAVQQALDGFKGLMAGALPVISCRVDGAQPDYQEETGQTHYHVDVLVSHK